MALNKKETSRLWRVNNKERVNSYAKKWREEHPEQAKAIREKFLNSDNGKLYNCKCSHIRRIRGKKIEQIYTANEVLMKIADTNGICPICNKQFTTEYLSLNEPTIDHIIPLSKVPEGYIYSIEDIDIICRSCNSKKYNKVNNSGR